MVSESDSLTKHTKPSLHIANRIGESGTHCGDELEGPGDALNRDRVSDSAVKTAFLEDHGNGPLHGSQHEERHDDSNAGGVESAIS